MKTMICPLKLLSGLIIKMNERPKISSITLSNIIPGLAERPPGRVVPTAEQRNAPSVCSNDPSLTAPIVEAIDTLEDPYLPPGFSTPLSVLMRASIGLGFSDVTNVSTLEVGQVEEREVGQVRRGVKSQVQIGQGSEEEVVRENPKNRRKKLVIAKVDTGPIAGGPSNETLLKSFRQHRAYTIWNKDEYNEVVNCEPHYKNMIRWKYEKESDRFKAKWMACGLTYFGLSCFKSINTSLINALVERWQPETNTFHLPFGEMTITLDDVAAILGIPVTGKPLFSTASPDSEKLLMDILGVSEEEATNELFCSSVKMLWLHKRFSRTLDQDDLTIEKMASTDAKVDAYVRAYILYVFGCSVFADKSGSKVHVQYLEDLDEIPKYNWGAAVLAYLYDQLSLASKATTKNMGGCFTLLQVWIHEHLKFLTPIANPAYNEGPTSCIQMEILC